MAPTFAPHQQLFETIAKSHPSLIGGLVRCPRCNKSRKVDAAQCLQHGWPKCCHGETMGLTTSPPVSP